MADWQFDADFGWYDADDPLGNIPNLATLPGTDVLRDPTGTYHPDIYGTGALPDPKITMANLQAMQNLPLELRLAGAQGGTQAQQFLARIVQEQALAAQAAQRAQLLGEGGAFGGEAAETMPTGATTVPIPATTTTTTGVPKGVAKVMPSPPLPKEGDEEVRNGVTYIYTIGAGGLGVWQPKQVSDMPTDAPPQASWDTLPEGSLDQILAKMNQDVYTTGIQGTVSPYASLTGLYNDAATYLTSQGIDPTDESIYTTMAWFAEQAAGLTGEKVSDKFFWYDKNIADWIFEGRPVSVGGKARATVFGEGSQVMLDLGEGKVVRNSDLAKITDPATRTRAATMLANNIVASMSNVDANSALGQLYNEYFDIPGTDVSAAGFGAWARSMGIQYDASGALVVTEGVTSGQPPTAIPEGTVSADGKQIFQGGKWGPISLAPAPATAEQSTWSKNYGAPGSQKAMDFIAMMDAGEFSRMTEDFKAYYSIEHAARIAAESGTAGTAAPGVATEVPDDLKGVFTNVTEYNDWVARGSPGAEDLANLGGFDPGQFALGPTVPATEGILAGITPQETFPQDVFRRFLAEQQGAPLSPFMQRGAQNLYPQLSAEYGFLPYMQGLESPSLPTFASFLQQGQRPTRGQMLGTLGDIGSVLSQGAAGTLAEGISPAEMLRRGRIQSAFGTESAESRQRLQSMLSGAFMSGIAPAFRYPVQAGIQNVFETQRALQPDKPFLSFLGERLS